jgi:hypothetical protein
MQGRGARGRVLHHQLAVRTGLLKAVRRAWVGGSCSSHHEAEREHPATATPIWAIWRAVRAQNQGQKAHRPGALAVCVGHRAGALEHGAGADLPVEGVAVARRTAAVVSLAVVRAWPLDLDLRRGLRADLGATGAGQGQGGGAGERVRPSEGFQAQRRQWWRAVMGVGPPRSREEWVGVWPPTQGEQGPA